MGRDGIYPKHRHLVLELVSKPLPWLRFNLNSDVSTLTNDQLHTSDLATTDSE